MLYVFKIIISYYINILTDAKGKIQNELREEMLDHLERYPYSKYINAINILVDSLVEINIM